MLNAVNNFPLNKIFYTRNNPLSIAIFMILGRFLSTLGHILFFKNDAERKDFKGIHGQQNCFALSKQIQRFRFIHGGQKYMPGPGQFQLLPVCRTQRLLTRQFLQQDIPHQAALT